MIGHVIPCCKICLMACLENIVVFFIPAAEVNIEDDIENKMPPPAAHANCTSAEERPYSRPPLVKDISSDSVSHSS